MRQILFLIGFMVLTALLSTAFSSMERERLDNSVFETPRRPGAVFAHDEHNDAAGLEECETCHHVYENGKRMEGESSEDSLCSDCHSPRSTDENPVPLTAAFHNRCKTCHFESRTGPVLCGECHIK